MIRKIKLAPLFFKYFFTFLFVTLDLSKSIFFVIFINNTLIFFYFSYVFYLCYTYYFLRYFFISHMLYFYYF